MVRIASRAGVVETMAILRQCIVALVSTYASSLQAGHALTPPSGIAVLQEREDYPGTGTWENGMRFVEWNYPSGAWNPYG